MPMADIRQSSFSDSFVYLYAAKSFVADYFRNILYLYTE